MNFNGYVTGTFADAGVGEASNGDWLGLGYSGDVEISGSRMTNGETATVDGAVSVGGAALEFTALTLDFGSCPDGATGGTIGVRQADATWYELALPDSCGSCGEVTWDHTEDIGEACLDLSPVATMLAAASSP